MKTVSFQVISYADGLPLSGKVLGIPKYVAPLESARSIRHATRGE
jgi:hypothetical protein